MRCPFCGHLETQVVETRDSDEGDTIRRRRKCGGCDKRFTTYERAEIELDAREIRDESHGLSRVLPRAYARTPT